MWLHVCSYAQPRLSEWLAIRCGYLPWPLMNTDAFRMSGITDMNNFDVYSNPNTTYIKLVRGVTPRGRY